MRGAKSARADGNSTARPEPPARGFAPPGTRVIPAGIFVVMRAALFAGALTLAAATSGCVAAIPLAFQAVEAVGAGVAHVAEAGAIESHQPEYGSELRKDEICDDLTTEIPLLAELRTDKSGKTDYRGLSLTGNDIEPRWVAMPNQGDATGWQVANNFMKMDFQPPIQPLLKADSINYIAYAPDPAQDATEQDQLNALTVAFGPSFGTFRWNNRTYRYAAVQKLPCFPQPAQ